MRYGTLYGVLNGVSLLGAECQNHDFLCTHHGGYAHAESLCRHLLGIVVEEAGIDLAGLGGKGDYAGA